MTYTTIQGDMFDSIAFKLWGDCSKMNLLIEANSKYREVYVFPAGTTLVIPQIETATIPKNLPIWKQVSG